MWSLWKGLHHGKQFATPRTDAYRGEAVLMSVLHSKVQSKRQLEATPENISQTVSHDQRLLRHSVGSEYWIKMLNSSCALLWPNQYLWPNALATNIFPKYFPYYLTHQVYLTNLFFLFVVIEIGIHWHSVEKYIFFCFLLNSCNIFLSILIPTASTT